jgi:hypothetical protein
MILAFDLEGRFSGDDDDERIKMSRLKSPSQRESRDVEEEAIDARRQ